MKTFEDIIAWQKAHQLVIQVYEITKGFPVEEKFGLVSQMRRAAVSITSNFVEGFARKSLRESLNLYNISNASLEELKYQLLISHDIGLIKSKEYQDLVEKSKEVGRLLWAWSESQKANGLSRSSC